VVGKCYAFDLHSHNILNNGHCKSKWSVSQQLSLQKCMTKHWLLFHPYNVHWLRGYNIVIKAFFPKNSTSSAVQVLRKNGQWKIPMYPFTVSMDMVQVSNVKIILCFHEEILKMGTSSEILIFRSAVMWLSIFKTIRLLYLM